MAFWEMLQSIMGYGYPPCGQTDGWMEGQTLVKTLPSLVLRTWAVKIVGWQEEEMDELDREIAKQLRRMIQRAEECDRLAEAYFSPTLVLSPILVVCYQFYLTQKPVTN